MATLKRPSNSKDKDIVGRFIPDGRCKKHPKHRQSPGVCSLCLRDKLLQLPSSSHSSRNKKTTTSISSSASSSLSSYYSSSASSSCASPTTHNNPLPFTNKGVSIFLLSAKHGGLVKSKSMADVPRTRERDKKSSSAKKSGFWFKLLHPKSKRSMKEKGTKLVHTRSLIEPVVS